MALLAKTITPSLCTLDVDPPFQMTKIATTDMAAGDLVYIKSDGLFTLADGTAATAPALAIGMINRACKAGQPITAFFGCEFYYGASLTPGARYYAAATAGRLDTAATTGGTQPVAMATGTNTIYVFPPIR